MGVASSKYQNKSRYVARTDNEHEYGEVCVGESSHSPSIRRDHGHVRRVSSIDLSCVHQQRRRKNSSVIGLSHFDGSHRTATALPTSNAVFQSSQPASPSPSIYTSNSRKSSFSVKFPSGGSLQRRLAAIANAAGHRRRRHRAVTSPFGSTQINTPMSCMSPERTVINEESDYFEARSQLILERSPIVQKNILGLHDPIRHMDSEADALDRLHYILQHTFGGRLHHVPIVSSTSYKDQALRYTSLADFEFGSVLEVACGTGIWSLELGQRTARQQPAVEIHAVDSRQLHPEQIFPDHLHFHTFGPLPGQRRESWMESSSCSWLPFPAEQFELVRAGLDPCAWLPVTCTSSEAILMMYRQRISDMMRVLRPRGWLEMIVSDWTVNSVPDVENTASMRVSRWLKLVTGIQQFIDAHATTKSNGENLFASALEEELRNAGFDQVLKTTYNVPIGMKSQFNKVPGSRYVWQPCCESVDVWKSLLTCVAQRCIMNQGVGGVDPMLVVEQWDDFAGMIQDWETELNEDKGEHLEMAYEQPYMAGMHPDKRWWQVTVVTARKKA